MVGVLDYNPAAIEMLTDRSLGDAGITVRRSVFSAVQPTTVLVGRHDEILRQLIDAFESNSQDGATLNVDAFTRAFAVLAAVPLSVPLPRIVVESPNEIGLDWDEGNRRVLSLTVDHTDMVGFSALLGVEPAYGRVQFGGRIPEQIDLLLSKVYPTNGKRRGKRGHWL